MSNPFPCNSIGNAQCAMANEIQRYRHIRGGLRMGVKRLC